MSSVVTNPARRARRAQIVAEAVVSAYIHEIAPTERGRERVGARATRASSESPRRVAHPSFRARSHGRAPAPRRRAAVELGA